MMFALFFVVIIWAAYEAVFGRIRLAWNSWSMKQQQTYEDYQASKEKK